MLRHLDAQIWVLSNWEVKFQRLLLASQCTVKRIIFDEFILFIRIKGHVSEDMKLTSSSQKQNLYLSFVVLIQKKRVRGTVSCG